MKRKLKKKNLIIMVAAALLLIGGVTGVILLNGKKTEPAKEETTEIKTEEKEETKPGEPKVQIVNLNSKSRPYAVMINNESYYARPVQSGLQDAYLVYEIIVEGGITRYMALFMDQQTERIGTVRSARHYYLDYALENDAIYVHHGRSPQAYSDFSKLGIDRIEINDTTTGWRDRNLTTQNGKKYPTEHTLYTSIEKLNSGLGSKRTERNKNFLLNYTATNLDTTAFTDKTTATQVTLKYSGYNTTSYEYDEASNVYRQFVNGAAHNDYVTKNQYTVKNIITYQVRNYTLDDGENKGRQDIVNIGSGDGYFITGGEAIPITWEKKSREGQTIYKYKSTGEEITVNDGNTWIHIVPTSGNISIS